MTKIGKFFHSISFSIFHFSIFLKVHVHGSMTIKFAPIYNGMELMDLIFFLSKFASPSMYYGMETQFIKCTIKLKLIKLSIIYIIKCYFFFLIFAFFINE